MRQVTLALWGHTRDQHHTELRQDEAGHISSMGTHKGPTSHRVEAGHITSMGTHKGPTSHRVEAG